MVILCCQNACSGALAGAGDSDVDELGHGDDRNSSVEDDAEKECQRGF